MRKLSMHLAAVVALMVAAATLGPRPGIGAGTSCTQTGW